MEKKENIVNSSAEEPKKGLHHKVIHHVQTHRNKVLMGLFSAIVVILFIMFITDTMNPAAKMGDNVKVNYVGTLDDGSVFDTSLEDVARLSSVYNSQRSYLPLQFTIGQKQVLTGFENGVIGMRKGDTKKINIPAGEGYPFDENLVVKDLPIVIDSPNIYFVLTSEFEKAINDKAVPGNEYAVANLSWKLRVNSIDTTTNMVNFSAVLQPGMVVQIPMRAWNATVVSVGDNIVQLKQNIKLNNMVATPDGRYGRVSRLDDKTYDIDMNLPIAGKPLNFEIELVEIVSK